MIQSTKPNILFILIDDMGWKDLTCQGSTFYETPNIDSVAREGMRFTNAYAACPVCSPTRASIMTGKYPARIGVTNYIGARRETGRVIVPSYTPYLPLEEISIAKALKKGGYHTYHVGKWHLGEEPYWPEHHGFDVNVAGCHWGLPGHGYFSPYGNPRLEDGPRREYLTDRLTDEAIKLLEQNGNEPFFLNMCYYSVHIPIQVPKPYKDKYKEKAKRLGLEKVKTYEDGEPFPCEHKKDMRIRRRLLQSDPAYAGMIEKLDENIGRLLQALKDLGKEKDTIVFFFSDNGGLSTAEGAPTCNLPLSEGKGWMYEGGTRDPLLVKWPGVIEPGTECDAPVTSTDFYPTFLQLAGLPLIPDQHCDGTSLMPLFEGKDIDERPIFWHYPHYGNQGGTPGSSIRLGDHKLIEFLEDGHLELYNLKDDISEKNNLADKEQELAKKLKKMLDEWRDDVHATFPEPNPDWPYYLFKHFLRFDYPLILDDDGIACLRIPISFHNPMLYEVPLVEILDFYLAKPLTLEISGTRIQGVLDVDSDGLLCIEDKSGVAPKQPMKKLIQDLVGGFVSLRAWKNEDKVPESFDQYKVSMKKIADPTV